MTDALRGGAIVAVTDVAIDPRLTAADRAAYGAANVVAFLIAPLIKSGRLVATFAVHGPEPREWSDGDAALLLDMVERTWDAVERADAEAALRRSEERYRALASAGDQTISRMNADWSIRREQKNGRSASAAAPISEWFEDHLLAQDRPAFETAIAAAIRDRSTFELEHRVRRVDGGIGWTLSRAAPILAADGTIVEWLGAAADITARKHAEAALRDSEEQQRLTVELVPALLWWTGPVGDEVHANARWSTYTGQSSDEAGSFGWLDAIHPDDIADTRAAFDHAFATGEPIERHQRVRDAGGGYRWHLVRQVPVRDGAGRITRWFGAAIDIDDLRRLQDRQELLVAELQHRVRNMLTVVRSVFNRTLEAGGDPDDLAQHFVGRLDSLARVHVGTTQSATGEVDLELLIRDELLSVGVGDNHAITVAGPDLSLPSRLAEPLALALHELTTNSLKYGALKTKGATLAIRWVTNMGYGETPRLDLTWTEQGVPAIDLRPARRGFGTELITEALPYRLGAETRWELRGGGVRCSLCVPLPAQAEATKSLG